MDALDVLRRQYARVATTSLGRSSENPRLTAGQVAWDGSEDAFHALPVDTTGMITVQDQATGGFYFTFDVSRFDGPDKWR